MQLNIFRLMWCPLQSVKQSKCLKNLIQTPCTQIPKSSARKDAWIPRQRRQKCSLPPSLSFLPSFLPCPTFHLAPPFYREPRSQKRENSLFVVRWAIFSLERRSIFRVVMGRNSESWLRFDSEFQVSLIKSSSKSPFIVKSRCLSETRIQKIWVRVPEITDSNKFSGKRVHHYLKEVGRIRNPSRATADKHRHSHSLWIGPRYRGRLSGED